ncbi:TPA: methyltransferase [Legionella pneumophila subsp. pneumophila]|uniref:methyltransferase domain-containing protein n=1 Tax=Legionella pneumophila TaxID=446 RepID=UPI0001E3C65B|nr:methyltransferase domain-containing protein [Legionella pneumophila]MDC8030083.1 Methyltransferase [Legionella pneumophila subsp. pneumophila]MDW8869959.1 methyltransferase domain-containing protein [Legionella pneumophila]MDW8915850.1 methyltransferase domain-containing protein [Legionella pneumophila]MDW8925498.1 methyltransferase domain-containing protein [Legionella pneumophila]MDW8931572.1 methyltransferase domain-containing protein [Legionella pneumophila]
MLIEHQIKHYRTLYEWFQSPLGVFVAKEFTDQLEPVKKFFKGETLLQLGDCATNPWLNLLDFKSKWIASPFSSTNRIHLECSLNQLPLNRDTLDCVIVPLTLEPFGNNFSLIDEIDRILKPMGFLIFLCINPWSLWGGAMKWGVLNCYGNRTVKLRSAFNLNRIFLQRGYKQCSLTNFCYIPPVNSQSLIKKLTFFDEIGKMIWPFPSGFYCYITQKYEYISPSLTIEPSIESVKKEYDSTLQPATN